MSSKIILALLATGLLFNTINAQDLAQNIQKKKEAYQKERAELLANKKSIESESHKRRIAILNRAEQCIHNAKTQDQYQACEKKEKAEREAEAKNSKEKKELNHQKEKALHDKIQQEKQVQK